MLSYKDFIDVMAKRGYTFSNNPIIINENSHNIKTFSIKNGSIGNILELQCPENCILSSCGMDDFREWKSRNWKKDYSISIKCFNNDGKEPFQNFHRCIVLTPDHHTVADIVVTKVLQNKIDRNDPNVQPLLKYTDPILRFINSNSPYEYPIWIGNYKTLNKEFLKESFNLYGNEKMIFYAIKPDIDITKVKFEIKLDIFEIRDKKSETKEELIILDKDKIVDITNNDYKHDAKAYII